MDDGAEPSPAAYGDPVILDVAGLSLETVFHTDDSVLADAVRQIVDNLGQPAENYAAHSTSV
ncbi:hypothetical protein [Virgisporangium aurantiacum]|uniref:FXSXX-COOH protein n=1 Tax=Virgisporangium aurantiacum TaxID=175570 RepID=A0A8J4DZQ7_9ACTN|nr:hypothetical protein [Virgisporangium aurantiacum]GIJ56169.1 hypothetical protein Vau01_036850 [Virgisporangium aurantiacum]